MKYHCDLISIDLEYVCNRLDGIFVNCFYVNSKGL